MRLSSAGRRWPRAAPARWRRAAAARITRSHPDTAREGAWHTDANSTPLRPDSTGKRCPRPWQDGSASSCTRSAPVPRWAAATILSHTFISAQPASNSISQRAAEWHALARFLHGFPGTVTVWLRAAWAETPSCKMYSFSSGSSWRWGALMHKAFGELRGRLTCTPV
jgi:hypothetical protein